MQLDVCVAEGCVAWFDAFRQYCATSELVTITVKNLLVSHGKVLLAQVREPARRGLHSAMATKASQQHLHHSHYDGMVRWSIQSDLSQPHPWHFMGLLFSLP